MSPLIHNLRNSLKVRNDQSSREPADLHSDLRSHLVLHHESLASSGSVPEHCEDHTRGHIYPSLDWDFQWWSTVARMEDVAH